MHMLVCIMCVDFNCFTQKVNKEYAAIHMEPESQLALSDLYKDIAALAYCNSAKGFSNISYYTYESK